MSIKETPTNYRIYYKLMHDRASKNLDDAREERDNLEIKAKELHNKLKEHLLNYKNTFNIDLTKYKEFNENKYIDGTFYKIARGLFMNRGANYELVSDLYDIYNYANVQKSIIDIESKIKHYNKLYNLTINEYNNLLKIFYTEVHKKLILEGMGYVFGEKLGWVCINRVLVKSKKKMLDFDATKKKEKELIAKGIKIYNKEEAAWCKANGIEYIAEDKRVYKNDEYFYEIPLIDCKLPNGHDLKLEIADYRRKEVRGKTNQTLIDECNENTNKICELNIDLKTKLTLCDKVDKILYTKFIRNENQKCLTFRTHYRKN